MLKSTRPAYLFPAGFLFGLAVAAIIAVTITVLLGSTLIIRPTAGTGVAQPAAALSNSAPAAAAPGKGVNGFVPLTVSAARGVTSAAGTRSGPGVNGFVPLTVSARSGAPSGGSSLQAADSAAQDITPALAARGINGFAPPVADTTATTGSSTRADSGAPAPRFGAR